jgi:3-oxoacyl-[acyl-carrier-protein] synthase III
MAVVDPIERRSVISGVGQSEIGRRLFRDPLDLTLDACMAAIEDAGLTTDQIDGIATYPGPMDTPPGFSGAGLVEVQDACGSRSAGTRAASSSRVSSAR